MLSEKTLQACLVHFAGNLMVGTFMPPNNQEGSKESCSLSAMVSVMAPLSPTLRREVSLRKDYNYILQEN